MHTSAFRRYGGLLVNIRKCMTIELHCKNSQCYIQFDLGYRNMDAANAASNSFEYSIARSVRVPFKNRVHAQAEFEQIAKHINASVGELSSTPVS